MGGEALAGRRVRRLLPGGRGCYEGTVVGAAGRPDRLVAIHYDNGDVEELDAEDLVDCLVPLPPRQRGLPRRAATAGAAAASAAAAEAEADDYEEEDEEDEDAARRANRRAAAGPYSERGVRAAARHAASQAVVRRRPRVASAGKRFRGTTLCGKSWKAQIHGARRCDATRAYRQLSEQPRVELHAARLRARCILADCILTRLACASKPTGDFTSAAATPPKRTPLARGTSLRAASAGLTSTSWTSQPSWRTWMDQVRDAGAPGRRAQAHTPASTAVGSLAAPSAPVWRLCDDYSPSGTSSVGRTRRTGAGAHARGPLGPSGGRRTVRGSDESHAPGSAACSRPASLPGLSFCSDAADRGIRGASQDSSLVTMASKSPLAPWPRRRARCSDTRRKRRVTHSQLPPTLPGGAAGGPGAKQRRR